MNKSQGETDSDIKMIEIGDTIASPYGKRQFAVRKGRFSLDYRVDFYSRSSFRRVPIEIYTRCKYIPAIIFHSVQRSAAGDRQAGMKAFTELLLNCYSTDRHVGIAIRGMVFPRELLFSTDEHLTMPCRGI